MDIKKIVNDSFLKKDDLIESRYVGAKILFIASTLLFFLNYFLVGARFNDDIFIKFLPFSYVLILISFCIFLFMIVVKTQKEKRILHFITGIGLFIIFCFFLVPILGFKF